MECQYSLSPVVYRKALVIPSHAPHLEQTGSANLLEPGVGNKSQNPRDSGNFQD